MNTPLHLWRNFGPDRDSKRRFPLVISLLAYLFSALVLTLTVFGQSRTVQPRAAQAQSSASLPADAGGRRDLSASLADLERVSQATDSDIANLHVEKWGAGWTKAITRSKDANQQQALQVAASLQRNLRGAMPGLIHDVQNARGTLSTTFKLYDNLSVVCEALDSLITAAEAKGKKEESAPLNEDYNALVHLRREFSNYIQAGTVALETKGKLPAYTGPASSASGKPGGARTVTGPGGVKRIIVDDEVPEKKPAATPAPKKKPAAATPSSATSGLSAPASAPAPVTARAVAPPAPHTTPVTSPPVASNRVAAAPPAVVVPPQAAAASVTSAPSTVSAPSTTSAPATMSTPATSAAATAPSQMQTLVPAPSASPTPKKKATVIYSN